MAVPEGATKLGTVGIAYKGVYDELATYKYANAVYYNGSTYIALIDNPAGFPSNDGVNWRYLAQGFLQQAISALTVIDESGILGEVDAEVNAQEFLSKIAELQKGLEDTKANKADVLDSLEEIVANTEDGRIAGANALSELNSNLTDLDSKTTKKWTKVWTSPSIGSGMGAKTISIDLSAYTEIMILARNFAQQAYLLPECIYKIGTSGLLLGTLNGYSTFRTFTVSKTSLAFANGTVVTGADASYPPLVCEPVEIYAR